MYRFIGLKEVILIVLYKVMFRFVCFFLRNFVKFESVFCGLVFVFVLKFVIIFVGWCNFVIVVIYVVFLSFILVMYVIFIDFCLKKNDKIYYKKEIYFF